MKLSIKNKILISACITICSLNITMAQNVTIGSGLKANEGALLDLKEENTLGANSTKGLMLPRVDITTSTDLLPLVSKLNVNPMSYCGAVVYNTNACLNLEGDDYGPMLWSGEEWELMWDKNPSSEVSIMADHEGNEYHYRTFGTAGTWMIENLRTKTYPPSIGATIQPELGLTADRGFLYPNQTYDKTQDDGFLTTYPSVGILYSISAVFNVAKSKISTTTFTGQQGICPDGWYVPTVDDWDVLENEILSHKDLYARDYASVPLTKYGKLLMSNCTLAPGTSGMNSDLGNSLPINQGGFSVLLVGAIEGGLTNGSSTLLLTSDKDVALPNGVTAKAYKKTGESSTANLRAGMNDVASIRCKKR